jgi:hypothetical protein
VGKVIDKKNVQKSISDDFGVFMSTMKRILKEHEWNRARMVIFTIIGQERKLKLTNDFQNCVICRTVIEFHETEGALYFTIIAISIKENKL